MIFDVQTILKTDGARVPVQGRLSVPEDFKDMEIRFTGEAEFFGSLKNVSGVLELTGEAKGRFTVPCARCMRPVEKSYCVSVSEALAHSDAEVTDRDAVVPFEGFSIDLDSVIWPDILLALDTKYLCAPDCKGLCPVCGADLNETDCACVQDEIDPRLAGLADLLK